MIVLKYIKIWTHGSPVLAFLSLGLWLLLLPGIIGGNISEVTSPSVDSAFFHGLSMLAPFLASAIAVGVILFRYPYVSQNRSMFYGPLGFAAIYGLVGFAASSFLSPDRSTALFWAGAYLTVPLVLWAISSSPKALDRASELLYVSWLGIIVVTVVLLFVGIAYLDLGSVIFNPSAIAKCQASSGWFDFTGGLLRSTGVGRYAAIAAIVAMGGLWYRNWGNFRFLWIIVLVLSVLLLITTGARTSFGGVFFAAILLVWTHLGWKQVLISGVLIIGIASIAWAIHSYEDTIGGCFLRKWEDLSGDTPIDTKPTETVVTVVPSGTGTTGSETAQNSGSTGEASTTGPSESTGSVSLVEEGETFEVSLPVASVFPNEEIDALISATPPNEEIDTLISATPPNEEIDALISATPPNEEIDALISATPPNEEIDALISATPPIPVQGQDVLRPSIALSPDAVTETGAGGGSPAVQPFDNLSDTGLFSNDIFLLTGRTPVWNMALNELADSPALGFGFHADRLVLNQHLHNSVIHAGFQTGILGIIPFLLAFGFAWLLIIRLIRLRHLLSGEHKNTVVTVAALLAFFTFRSLLESPAALFGVDWLFVGPLLLYMSVLYYCLGTRNKKS
jgi:hypothetical protein